MKIVEIKKLIIEVVIINGIDEVDKYKRTAQL